LTSSSSGPQLSPGSPPAGGKAVRGRGRGRTRGRGSLRISADDSRQVHLKEEQEEDAAAVHAQHTATSEADKTLMDAIAKAEPAASDSMELQAQGSGQTAADRTSHNSVAPAQALLTAIVQVSVVPNTADHDLSMSAVPEPSMQQSTPLSTQPLAAPADSLTAGSMPPKQSDLLVEEDDYDADEC